MELNKQYIIEFLVMVGFLWWVEPPPWAGLTFLFIWLPLAEIRVNIQRLLDAQGK